MCLRRVGCVLFIILAVALTIASVADAQTAASAAIETTLPVAEHVGSVEAVEVLDSTLNEVDDAEEPAHSTETVNAATPALDPSSSVYAVVMHGHFVDTDASTPHWASAPTGSIMAFTVNANTGHVVSVYVGNDAPTSVGAVALNLRASSAKIARMPRVRTARARAAAARRHPKAKTATWGSKCSAGNGHHCYALAVWEMGKGEEVYGSETFQWTSKVDVPYSEDYDFIDNEEWVGFPGDHWVEMGNTNSIAEAGVHSCCKIYAFTAKNNSSGYQEWFLWEKYVEEWSAYTMDPVGNDTWCYYVGEYKELGEGCVGGLENYSKDLEVGAEFADEAQPENLGWDETDGIWGPHGEAHQWNFATDGLWNETGKVSYNGMCGAPYTPYDYAGNIYYGTYGTCP
jgi:hypothetical protein